MAAVMVGPKVVTFRFGKALKRQFLMTDADYIVANYQRLSVRGVKLVPITTDSELYEGMELEREGMWYEIFMWDHVNDHYYLMRLD